MASIEDRVITFDSTIQRDLTLFIRETFASEDEALQQVRQNIIDHNLPVINIRAEEGQMLYFLAQLIGAKRILEIGTLAGYSGIWLARGLAPGGTLTTLELDPRHAQIARDHFELAGVADRVTVIEGEAMNTLNTQLGDAIFDMIFIDADKPGYPDYLAWSVKHIRPGGLITAHNAFRGGKLFEDNEKANPTRAMLNQLARDENLVSTIVPVGDGLAAAIMK